MQERHVTVEKTARYFTIGNEDKPSEVWIACHGYTQLAHQFIQLLAPLDDGMRLIVCPEGLNRFYTDHKSRRVGAGWMTSEDRLVEIDDYIQYLDKLYAAVFERVDHSAVRCHVLGFSQGVAATCRWVVNGGTAVDRLIMWGGLLPPEIDLILHKKKLTESHLTIVLGDEDELVSSQDRTRQEDQLREHEIPFKTIVFAGGHRLDRTVLGRLAGGE